MKPFEQEPVCPKCLSKDVNVRYEKGTGDSDVMLMCTCKRCRYWWLMNVAPEPEEVME